MYNLYAPCPGGVGHRVRADNDLPGLSRLHDVWCKELVGRDFLVQFHPSIPDLSTALVWVCGCSIDNGNLVIRDMGNSFLNHEWTELWSKVSTEEWTLRDNRTLFQEKS